MWCNPVSFVVIVIVVFLQGCGAVTELQQIVESIVMSVALRSVSAVCVVHANDIDKSYTLSLVSLGIYSACESEFYSPFMTLEAAVDKVYLGASSGAFDCVTSSSSAGGVLPSVFFPEVENDL